MNKYLLAFLWLAVALTAAAQPFDPIAGVRNYHVVWDSPSQNSLGSMPIGNGDIGLNVWVEENGDLQMYLSKTDSWSENAQLLKLGKIRIKITPNPFGKGMKFRQELDLVNGQIQIQAGGPGNEIRLTLWVDACQPVAEIQFESQKPVVAEVILEPWRKAPRVMKDPEELPSVYGIQGNPEKPVVIDPDVFLPAKGNRLTWYHRNQRSIWTDNLALQGLGEWAKTHQDPLLNRTFGASVAGEGMKAVSDLQLSSTRKVREGRISIYPLTTLTGSAEQWEADLERQITGIGDLKITDRIKNHRAWWSRFWTRSYVFVGTEVPAEKAITESITRGYILQRYINACGGRGKSPIKFNGTIFTVDTYNRSIRKGFDADFRLWGGPYWFQNTRLPYWSMLAAGDYDLMKPLFSMYLDALPVRKEASKLYYGHGGAFFPETMYFWGTYNDENYGRNRKGMPDGLTQNTYIRYYWTSGLEMSQMMLEYFRQTGSLSFAADTLLPFATEILHFFDRHWPRDLEGKILFTPAQSLETYQTAVNPTPDLAGLRFLIPGLLQLPQNLVPENLRKSWAMLLESIPEIPFKDSPTGRIIAPASYSAHYANIENPELYAVWPFALYSTGKSDLDLAVRTWHERIHKMNIGWQHSAVQAACLGLADEAALLVADKFTHADPDCRFPAFWGPNYDWSPDQDHGTVGMIALQKMILVENSGKPILLPAWPKNWNLEFRLWGPDGKPIVGSYQKGNLTTSQSAE